MNLSSFSPVRSSLWILPVVVILGEAVLMELFLLPCLSRVLRGADECPIQ
jgi:hypothetical protein